MSNFVLEFSSDKASSFTAGINEGVTLDKFEFVSENENEYIQLSFSKNGSVINDRIYPPSKVTPKKIAGVMQTEAQAWAKAWGDVNAKIRHIVLSFCTEEVFQKALEQAKPKNFTQYVKVCSALLPKNFREVQGRLILGYNTKGYLAVPYAMWVTGPFFSTNSNTELSISSRITLERPQQEKEDFNSNEEGFLGRISETDADDSNIENWLNQNG
jgi:hypothetical protein